MAARRHCLRFVCCLSLAAASQLGAAPGCTCTEPCDGLGTCKIPASERLTCPFVWWDTPEFGTYATCVDARQLRVITDFQAFPNNAAGVVTWDLPCASLSAASESLGFKSDVTTSPCFFPEITALYAEALQDATYANDAQVLKIRANVIDVSALTTTTTTHWCRGHAFVSDGSCICLNGGNSCQGSGCSNYDTSSWYDNGTCATCNCTAKASTGTGSTGRFTQEIFEQSITLLNTRKDVTFLNFSAAAYRSKAITQSDYDRIFRNGFDTSSSEVRYLFELFGAPYDAQMPGNSATRHNMSEYLEMFVVPSIGDGGTSGVAHSRGQKVNDSLIVPPAIYIGESSSDTVAKATPLIGHELGHTLGLLHTFSGLKNEYLQKSTCSQCLPTEANAATAGDFITDTPPTSSLHAGSRYPAPIASNLTECTVSFNSTGLCTQLSGGVGNMRNLMAYGADECQATFTPQQLARMRCWMDQDFSRTHLPNLGPGLVLLSATYVKVSCKVQLAWLPPVSEVWCPQALCAVTSYRILRRVNVGAWEVIGTTQGATRVFDDTNISAGSTSHYKVIALGPGGEGSAVAKIVVIDQACAASPPSPSPSPSPASTSSPSPSPAPSPSPSASPPSPSPSPSPASALSPSPSPAPSPSHSAPPPSPSPSPSPASTLSPSASPAPSTRPPSPTTVAGSLTVIVSDTSVILSNASAKTAFENAMATELATAAGNGVAPADVNVTVSAAGSSRRLQVGGLSVSYSITMTSAVADPGQVVTQLAAKTERELQLVVSNAVMNAAMPSFSVTGASHATVPVQSSPIPSPTPSPSPSPSPSPAPSPSDAPVQTMTDSATGRSLGVLMFLLSSLWVFKAAA